MNKTTPMIKTYTLFKNTNDTLEGIEAISFAMWQVALDEADKEGNSTILMSEKTLNIIKKELLDRKYRINKLEEIISNYKKYGSPTIVRPSSHTDAEFNKLYNQKKGLELENEYLNLRLNEVRSILNEAFERNSKIHNEDNIKLDEIKGSMIEWEQ